MLESFPGYDLCLAMDGVTTLFDQAATFVGVVACRGLPGSGMLRSLRRLVIHNFK